MCDWSWIPTAILIWNMVGTLAVLAVVVLLLMYSELRHNYRELLTDDGRLIDILTERAKAEIDQELRRG
jgi:hypothetical protein